MSETMSSSGRSSSVRKTYSARQKQRKRESAAGNVSVKDESEGSEALNSQSQDTDMKESPGKGANGTTTQPSSPALPKVSPTKPSTRSQARKGPVAPPTPASQASSMPPPSQVTPQRTFNIPTVTDPFSTPPVTRRSMPRASSVASVSTSPTTLKPAQFDLPDTSPSSSSNRADSPEDSGDEGAGVEDATPARKRKSEADRLQFFKEDPACKEIEPLRALCANCNTWVDLHDKRKYVMKDWVVHQKLCKRSSVTPISTPVKPPVIRIPARVPASINKDSTTHVKDEETETPPPVPKAKLRRFTEAERKAILENDPRSGEVRPQEVFCIPCNKFIRLSSKTSYALYNWEAHSSKCAKAHPLPLPQYPTSQKPVSQIVPPPQSPATNGMVVDPSRTYNSPGKASLVLGPEPGPSTVESTSPEVDATVVANGNSRKRAREDDTDDESENTRLVRQRTEDWSPVRGLWRRLSTPIFNFVRGFREGFGTSNSSPSIS